MATAEELQDSLNSFAESCNENTRLMAMIKDWNRVMHIRATDLGADAALNRLSALAVRTAALLVGTADSQPAAVTLLGVVADLPELGA